MPKPRQLADADGLGKAMDPPLASAYVASDAPKPQTTLASAVRACDPDGLQDVLLEYGADMLEMGIPYIARAARWRARDSQRRDARRASILARHPPIIESVWDPLDRIAADELRTALVRALADLSNVNLIIVWDHFSGASDTAILQKIIKADPSLKSMTLATLRKRRQRAVEGLRQRLRAEGHDP